MATTGHWISLTEAQKATQGVLLQGVVETVIEAGGLLPMLPVRQMDGQDITYDREVAWDPEDGAQSIDQEEQLGWTSDVSYTQKTVALKIIARQDRLDRFKANTYSNINDYRSLLVQEVTKRAMRYANHLAIYGDIDGDAKQFDGIHTLNKDETQDIASGSADDTSLNIDMEEGALALSTLRLLLNNCKVDQIGRDKVAIFVNRQIATRFDAAFQEAALVRSGVTHSLAQIMFGSTEIGGQIPFFDGVPVIRTDFLRAEQANSGIDVGASKRALHTSGDKQYSLFVVRMDSIESGGLEAIFGDPAAPGTTAVSEGEFKGFARESFATLENYIAGGERIYSFISMALGAAHSLGRIFDIENVPIIP